MKALLINGSPRPNGCTFTALTELANTLEAEGIETEIVHVGNKDIRGCIACRRCHSTGSNKLAYLDTLHQKSHVDEQCFHTNIPSASLMILSTK